ncbi:metal dependent phosphohydrolase [Nitrosospira multiformis ATCC 25196]|uniref:Metal dependent phosphohydrolase n=1 Tax=Nitrosospira multiformis (strain ATCC 25196 / NCIMB 11849 / C 71) TaxID=323848 RepID=Q2Y8G0_NITMU|nr:HD domain-containing phosphohydrolase [Nitrosospira multiformis]ABB74961.1 metal dependent phosphohydrolase [Nitrosospira multiformis ATCC 25196]SEG00435.1 metal dependent phosphohydrolase [Nitrosospira multiformis ATCC 25196]
MSDHRDALENLNHHAPLSEKLKTLHAALGKRFTFIDRVAVAIYDPKTDELKTFIHSSGEANPLVNYQAKLSQARSLQKIRESGKPRVVNDLTIFVKGTQEHTHRIATEGYGASYTVPMYFNGDFFGFVFFNSYRTNVFDEEVLHLLDMFAHLISLVVMGELASLRTLISGVHAARNFANMRDTETGAHLERMSRYARIVAKELAPKYGFDDEYVEQIFLFSPLHDIGKIGIPDSILLKAGLLEPGEREIMKTHSEKGRQLIDSLLRDFRLDSFGYLNILRNIAEHHHETLDGEGYPHRLRGGEIPIESRIVAVADVFDALTSKRPYKEAWNMDEAFQELRKLAGSKLDSDCVEALIKNRVQLEEIRNRFQEPSFS